MSSYAERFASKPVGISTEDSLLALMPDEIVVDHPDADTPDPRQAGTLGEGPQHAIALVKETAERSLYYFNLVFMGGYTLMKRQPHQWYCDFLQAVPPLRKLLLAPRGTLKTTITGGLTLHFFIQPDGANVYFPHGKLGYLNHSEGRSTRLLLGSKGAELSQEKLILLRTHIENSALLRAFWPHCFWQDPRRQATAWNNERLFLPRMEAFKEGSIETTGVGGTITGAHFNVGLYDDLVAEEDRFSVTNQERAYNWVHAARFLLDDRDRAHEIYLGTHWSNNDIYVRMKRDDPTLEHRTFSAIQPDGSPLWPEVFPLEVIQAIEADLVKAGKGDLFALNYLNDPHHQSITSFNMGQVRYFRIEGDQLIIDDDDRDVALVADFIPGQQRLTRYPTGTKLTPETYHQHRDDMRASLRYAFQHGRYQER